MQMRLVGDLKEDYKIMLQRCDVPTSRCAMLDWSSIPKVTTLRSRDVSCKAYKKRKRHQLRKFELGWLLGLGKVLFCIFGGDMKAFEEET